MRREPKWIEWLGRINYWLIICCGAVMTLLTFYNVVSRYVFKWDLAWSTEFVIFLMVWSTFLGSAAAVQRNAHLSVNELINRASERTRIKIDVYVHLVTIMLLVLMGYYGINLAKVNMTQYTMAMQMPVGYWYAAMPTGSALMIVFSINHIYQIIKHRKPMSYFIEETEERS